MTLEDVEHPEPQEDDFALLMERVRTGCPDAAREVCERYGDHIRRVIRRRLHQRMRTQYDSLDFTQDVWASFFNVPLQEYTFETPDALVGFLAELAYRKVGQAFRKQFKLQKHNLDRERPLEKNPDVGLPVRGPTPSQFAIANEQWERMLDGQPASHRLLLEMIRQGHNHREIAERTGLHPKMIQRFLHKLAQLRNNP